MVVPSVCTAPCPWPKRAAAWPSASICSRAPWSEPSRTYRKATFPSLPSNRRRSPPSDVSKDWHERQEAQEALVTRREAQARLQARRGAEGHFPGQRSDRHQRARGGRAPAAAQASRAGVTGKEVVQNVWGWPIFFHQPWPEADCQPRDSMQSDMTRSLDLESL